MRTDLSMELTNQEAEQRIAHLQEMITCGFDVWIWHYDSDGNLLKTNCRDLVIDKIFAGTGCKAYMLEQVCVSGVPMILSAKLGLMWGAAFRTVQDEDGERKEIYVLGPVFNTSVSLDGINQALKAASQQYEIPMDWKPFFKDILKRVPVLGSGLFFQYVLMLHWCLTGEKLSRGVIHFQKAPEDEGPLPRDKGDRHQTYQIEQALLDNVRKGNLNYRSELDRAGMISNGLRISTDVPITQAIYSEVAFISLCTRAAIEGGMSPDAAYTLGDSYIQSLSRCKTITELRNIGHEMYADFICKVHALRADPALSAEVLFCKDYIEMHPYENLSLDGLAGQVGYAPQYLSRKFRKETGTGVNDYIRKIRIERAQFLLSTSDESIADISEELHFCSSSHFSDTFRKATGMLPQEYRKQTRKI